MTKLDRSVFITREANEFLWTAIRAVQTEICGMGYLRREPEGDWLWYKTLLGPQEVSGGGADFTDPAYFIGQAAKDEVLGNPDHSWVWWHSHHTMGAYWSTTDEEGVETWRDQSGLPHVFSFVGNHKGEYRLRLDVFDHELLPQITFDIDSLVVERDLSITEEVERDIKCFVSAKKYEPKVTKADEQKQLPKHSGFGFGSADCLEFLVTGNQLITLTETLEQAFRDKFGDEWFSDIEFDADKNWLLITPKTEADLADDPYAQAWADYEAELDELEGKAAEVAGNVF
jgi:hypothetical protein